MKIKMFNLYRGTFIVFWILSAVCFAGAFALSAFLGDGSKDDFVIISVGMLLGVLCIFIPLILYRRQCTSVYLNSSGCTSHSIVGKKLCYVDFNKTVYYSLFNIQFLYETPIKLIAVSNMPICSNSKNNEAFKKRFYGSYNRKSIMVFIYNEESQRFLKTNEWQKSD